MSSLRTTLIVSLLTVAVVPIASAQESKVGLVIGYPLDVGVMWQASGRVAVRADAGFTSSSSEFSTSFGPTGLASNSSSAATSLGVSVLFTIHRDDNLRVYLAPRAGLRLLTSSLDADVVGGLLPGATFDRHVSESSTGKEAQGMLGAHYRLNDRFAVFGETGFSYAKVSFPRLSLSSGTGASSQAGGQESRQVGVRSTIGIVWFF